MKIFIMINAIYFKLIGLPKTLFKFSLSAINEPGDGLNVFTDSRKICGKYFRHKENSPYAVYCIITFLLNKFFLNFFLNTKIFLNITFNKSVNNFLQTNNFIPCICSEFSLRPIFRRQKCLRQIFQTRFLLTLLPLKHSHQINSILKKSSNLIM